MIGFHRLVQEGIRNPRGLIELLVHLPQFIKLYVRLFRDPRVPLYLKLLLVLAVIYVISPLDLVPEVLFQLIGQVDDLVILLLVLKLFLKKCPRHVLVEHVREIEAEGLGLFR